MQRFAKLLLPLLMAGALVACDQKEDREDKIVANLPIQQAYENNVEKMATVLEETHPRVPKEKIKEVLRSHLTVQDQHRDLFKLYSEKNFTDAEFDTIVEVTHDPVKARDLNSTEQGKQLSTKLTKLMIESAEDPKTQAEATMRMQQVEKDLAALEKATP
ncbi:hypothetical protein PS627_04047 [Pseudomonas fluorescens]|uniref:hypothetical protein n=1 Tax=Pseudomonas fluorescens TaxID=294 RepID=UPI001259602C|nr:hypothetical protein [Pseudomonas fluorescens]CAG8870566.1 hypothetical protein PS627_04047 [Pseudomonas fluorescens]VVP69354.1 hypothetical protein PS910_00567 [Pseudomonas fluorescens]